MDSALNQVVSVAGGRVRARASTWCDTEQTNRVDFQPGEVVDIAKHEAPLLVDTAGTTKDGLYSMDADEHSMLLDVARAATAWETSQLQNPDERTSRSYSLLFGTEELAGPSGGGRAEESTSHSASGAAFGPCPRVTS